MPEFDLPHFDPEVAEETYAGIKRHCEEQTGWEITERRVFRVEYTHSGGDHLRTEWDAEVGRMFEYIGEDCVAIFESNCFLVCTPNRGVLSGPPVMVGQPHAVVDFD